MVVELGPEVSHPARERQGRQALVVAQRGGRDVVREVRQQRRVGGLRGARPRSRSPISYSRRRPIRHGMDLPQAASAENFVSSRARSTMQARSSAMTTEPGADVGAGLAQGVERRTGVSSEVGGQEAAGRSAHEDGLELAAARAAGEPHELAQRRAQRDLGDAAALGAAQLDEDRARAAVRCRSRRTPRAPLTDDPRDGGQGLDVVDDGGPVEQARSVGYGGRWSGWPRLPSRALMRTVSSPSM